MLVRAFPKRIEIRYQLKIKQIIDEINKQAINRVLPSVRDYVADGTVEDIGIALKNLINAFDGVGFALYADRIARMFVDDILKYNNRTLEELVSSVSFNAYESKAVQDVIKLATQQNAQLIKSIASQHLDAISNIVYSNIQAGNRASVIESSIREYGVSYSRAKLIARDQTSKVMSSISKARMIDAGFEYFQWDTSHDERVRPSHKEAQNKITEYGKGVYRWNELPIVDGEKASPGTPINCRCVALPVLEIEVEEFQKRGKK